MTAAMALWALLTAAGPAARHAPDVSTRLVLVELFTSEGCSSCPPADALLSALDRQPAVAGARVVALELHVDYWNQLGWADPFSSAAFSARQEAYARALGESQVYTPEAIVNGAAAVVGSRADDVKALVAHAALAPLAKVSLARVEQSLAVKVSEVPPGDDSGAEVWLAVTERGLTTWVLRGENAGRHLEHGPVVRSLEPIGQLRGGTFDATIPAPLPAGVNPANARYVVFVQARGDLHVLGVGTLMAREGP